MVLEMSNAARTWHTYRPEVARRALAATRRTDEAMRISEPEPDMSALLLEVGRRREVETFEVLFRHFAPRVKAYMARTGSPAAAEELMQETMVAVWNKAALYDPSKGAASTWIFSIARNQRIDAYRREKRPEFDPDDPALQPGAETPADAKIEGDQSARLVRTALGTLPPDQAEVMRLAFYEDNSQSEIAAALDLPLGTVKSRMRLAFAKLRTALGQTGELT